MARNRDCLAIVAVISIGIVLIAVAIKQVEAKKKPRLEATDGGTSSDRKKNKPLACKSYITVCDPHARDKGKPEQTQEIMNFRCNRVCSTDNRLFGKCKGTRCCCSVQHTKPRKPTPIKSNSNTQQQSRKQDGKKSKSKQKVTSDKSEEQTPKRKPPMMDEDESSETGHTTMDNDDKSEMKTSESATEEEEEEQSENAELDNHSEMGRSTSEHAGRQDHGQSVMMRHPIKDDDELSDTSDNDKRPENGHRMTELASQSGTGHLMNEEEELSDMEESETGHPATGIDEQSETSHSHHEDDSHSYLVDDDDDASSEMGHSAASAHQKSTKGRQSVARQSVTDSDATSDAGTAKASDVSSRHRTESKHSATVSSASGIRPTASQRRRPNDGKSDRNSWQSSGRQPAMKNVDHRMGRKRAQTSRPPVIIIVRGKKRSSHKRFRAY